MLRGAHEHRPDVAAVEGEQVADACALEGEGDQLAGVAGVVHSAIAWGIAGVLNAACGDPSRPMTMTPPSAPSAFPR